MPVAGSLHRPWFRSRCMATAPRTADWVKLLAILTATDRLPIAGHALEFGAQVERRVRRLVPDW